MNKFFVTIALITVMIVAGCAPTAGVDPVRTAEKEFALQSYEGKLTVSFDLDIDEEAIDPLNTYEADQVELYTYLQGLKLTLTDLLVDNANGVWSANGTVEKNRLKVPFSFYANGERAVVRIDGAKRPLILEKGITSLLEPAIYGYGLPYYGMLNGYFTGEAEVSKAKIWQQLIKLGVSSIPAAKGLSVRQTDKGYAGTEIAFRAEGAELIQLLRTQVRSMALDDQGLRQLAGVFYEYFAEEAKSDPDRFAMFLNDKQISVEGIYGIEKAILAYLAVDSMRESERSGLGGTAVDVSLTVDSDQVLRALELQTTVNYEPGDSSALKSFKFNVSFERGQINRAIQPNAIDSKDGLSLFELDTPEQLLEQVDEKSDLYRYLKDELKLTRKRFSVSLDDRSYIAERLKWSRESGETADDYPYGYFSNDVAYGPAGLLAAKLGYESALTRSEDGGWVLQAGDKKLAFKTNSSSAVVNGKSVEMGGLAEIVEGTLFVPIRFLVEQLDGRVKIDPEYMYYIEVERD